MKVFEELQQDYWPIPKGWYPLMKKLLEDLIKIDPNIEILQMKEKWGGMRVYFSPYSENVNKIVDEAEVASLKICDTCGEPGNLRTINGWVQTVCEKHAK